MSKVFTLPRKLQVFTVALLLPACLSAQVTPADTSVVSENRNDPGYSVQPKKDSALPLPPPPGVRAHLYRMNYWVSGSLSLVATIGNLHSINRIRSKERLTSAELAGLNPDAFNEFERWGLRQDPFQSQKYDKASDYVLQGILLGTVSLGFDKAIRQDVWRLLMMYYETHSLTFSLYNYSFFGPTFHNKYRPVAYSTQLSEEVRTEGNNKNSLYSGHTASAAAATFFMAKVYNDYHPEFSPAKKYMLYGLASIPPLLEGYYRLKAMKHFPSDILVGFVLGAACGVAVPEFHRFKRQAIKYSLIGTPAGPGICLTWNPSRRVN